MSTVAISYRDINKSARQAERVAKKLDKYSASIGDHIINKLNSYSGPFTADISSALSEAKAKQTLLEDKAEKQRGLSTKLFQLEQQCRTVDSQVRDNIANLTATFKTNNGIQTSFSDSLHGMFVGFMNSNAATRWLKDSVSNLSNDFTAFQDSIKHWYNYKGGKQFLSGMVEGILNLAIGIAAIVVAVVALIGASTVFAVIAAVAGIILGVIAVVNAFKDMDNESKAYELRQDKGGSKNSKKSDPAQAYNLSKQNTWQDSWRATGRAEDRAKANALDITEGVCTVISVVHSGGQVIKKGYKWMSGSTSKLADIKFSTIFSKNTWGQLASKSKQAFSSTKIAFKARDIDYFKQAGQTAFNAVKGNFAKNIENKFFNYGSLLDTDMMRLMPSNVVIIDIKNLGQNANCIKSTLSLTKSVYKNGSMGGLKEILLSGTVLIPNDKKDVTVGSAIGLAKSSFKGIKKIIVPTYNFAVGK